jgi:hypothetical protein
MFSVSCGGTNVTDPCTVLKRLDRKRPAKVVFVERGNRPLSNEDRLVEQKVLELTEVRSLSCVFGVAPLSNALFIPSLRRLKLLGCLRFVTIAESLRYCGSLTSLLFDPRALSPDSFLELLDILGQGPVKRLEMEVSGSKHLFHLFSQIPRQIEIHLRFTGPLSGLFKGVLLPALKCYKSIEEAIRGASSRVRSLKLPGIADASDAKALARILKRRINLERLKFSFSPQCPKICAASLSSLVAGKSLRHLTLSCGNDIFLTVASLPATLRSFSFKSDRKECWSYTEFAHLVRLLSSAPNVRKLHAPSRVKRFGIAEVGGLEYFTTSGISSLEVSAEIFPILVPYLTSRHLRKVKVDWCGRTIVRSAADLLRWNVCLQVLHLSFAPAPVAHYLKPLDWSSLAYELRETNSSLISLRLHYCSPARHGDQVLALLEGYRITDGEEIGEIVTAEQAAEFHYYLHRNRRLRGEGWLASKALEWPKFTVEQIRTLLTLRYCAEPPLSFRLLSRELMYLVVREAV